MRQASAASSIALSSAIEPVASPGARMNIGVPVSIRTAVWEVAMAGLAYSVCEASAAGSKKSSKVLVVIRAWCARAVSVPSAPAPMRSRWRVGGRWPTGPYICSRRSTSFTGRPTSRAARMPSTCGPAIRPLDPNPPPRNGLRIMMFSGAMPSSPASRACAMAMPWLGMSSDRLSPSHAATTACGSIALWYCAGVS